MSPTAVNDKITATVKDNTGADVTSSASITWKAGSETLGTGATYTIKDTDAGKTITVSAKVGDVDATPATATVKAAETEEDDGKYDLTVTYGNTTARTYAKVSNVEHTDADSVVTNVTTFTSGVAKENELKKNDTLTFEVLTLGAYKNTVTVKMGGESVTPKTAAKSAAATQILVYTVEKVTGDVEIEVSTVKNTEYTLTLVGGSWGKAENASDGTASIALNADGNAANAKTLTTAHNSLPTEVTENTDEATLSLKVAAGDTVVITNDDVLKSPLTNGEYKLNAGGLKGEVNATSGTLTFVMPEADTEIANDVFDLSNKEITIHFHPSLTVTTSATNVKKVGSDYQITDGTNATFDVKSPTNYYIVVDKEDATVGTASATTANAAVATGTLSESKWVYPAYVVTYTAADAASVKTAAGETVNTGSGVKKDTVISMTKGTGGAGTIAVPTASITGGVSNFKGENIAKAKAADETPTYTVSANVTLYAASPVAFGSGVSAKLNGKALTSGDYVMVGTNVNTIGATDTSTATDNTLWFKVTGGTTVMALTDSSKKTGEQLGLKVPKAGLKDIVAGVVISGNSAATISYEVGDATIDATTSLNSAPIYIMPGTEISVTTKADEATMTAKDTEGVAISGFTKTVTSSGEPSVYTLTVPTTDVVLTETAPAAKVTAQKPSVDGTGAISNNSADTGNTAYYALVTSSLATKVASITVEMTEAQVNDFLGVTLSSSAPTIAAADNGKYLVMVIFNDSTHKATKAGESDVIKFAPTAISTPSVDGSGTITDGTTAATGCTLKYALATTNKSTEIATLTVADTETTANAALGVTFGNKPTISLTNGGYGKFLIVAEFDDTTHKITKIGVSAEIALNVDGNLVKPVVAKNDSPDKGKGDQTAEVVALHGGTIKWALGDSNTALSGSTTTSAKLDTDSKLGELTFGTLPELTYTSANGKYLYAIEVDANGVLLSKNVSDQITLTDPST